MLRMCINYFQAFMGNKKGQGMVEYGLILALIAVVVIAALTTMGDNLFDMFNGVAEDIAPQAAPAE